MNLTKLVQAIESDSNLSSIPANERLKAIQLLYIMSGCDYTSFFYGFSKSVFFNTFIANIKFVYNGIIGEQVPLLSSFNNLPGACTDCHSSNEKCSVCSQKFTLGLLAFYRLIGSLYFRASKHF